MPKLLHSIRLVIQTATSRIPHFVVGRYNIRKLIIFTLFSIGYKRLNFVRSEKDNCFPIKIGQGVCYSISQRLTMI